MHIILLLHKKKRKKVKCCCVKLRDCIYKVAFDMLKGMKIQKKIIANDQNKEKA